MGCGCRKKAVPPPPPRGVAPPRTVRATPNDRVAGWRYVYPGGASITFTSKLDALKEQRRNGGGTIEPVLKP